MKLKVNDIIALHSNYIGVITEVLSDSYLVLWIYNKNIGNQTRGFIEEGCDYLGSGIIYKLFL